MKTWRVFLDSSRESYVAQRKEYDYWVWESDLVGNTYFEAQASLLKLIYIETVLRRVNGVPEVNL